MKIPATLGLLLFVGCAAPHTTAKLETLTSDVEPLRQAFEAAAGQVRAILLASPT